MVVLMRAFTDILQTGRLRGWVAGVLLVGYSAIAVAQTVSGQPENPATDARQSQMRIGVLAYRGVDAAMKHWQPLSDYLSRTIDNANFILVPVTLDSASEKIENKQIDFLITNPGHYVTLAARFALSALATRERRIGSTGKRLLQYGSVIFVRNDSSIEAISDLKGKTIAAVSPDAFGGFQIAWNEMREQGVDAFKDVESVRYMGFPQDAIVAVVRRGDIDAGIVRSGLLEKLVEEGILKSEELRVINANKRFDHPYKLSSQLYPEWPFAALPSTAESMKVEVLRSLLNTQYTEISRKHRLQDTWSAPLSYDSVRFLVQSFRTRTANGSWITERNVPAWSLFLVAAV